MQACEHYKTNCLNLHEIVRKYACSSCNEVMMCECERDIGERFLPHQTTEASISDTGRRVPVTLGFQNKVCPSCRGEIEIPSPHNGFGVTSKIRRYYWREITHKSIRLFLKWSEDNAVEDAFSAAHGKHFEIYNKCKREALEFIKLAHDNQPKYDFTEKSQNDFLNDCKIDILKLSAKYMKDDLENGLKLIYGKKVVSPEEFVSCYFNDLGYTVLELESRPFHALFGIFMWTLIQGPEDDSNRLVCFGSRKQFDPLKPNKERIYCTLPEDFGTKGYYERRKEAIEEHISLIPNEKEEMLWLFDYSIIGSENLREYLWAHEEIDVKKARNLVEILPALTLKEILLYLTESYWDRYLGWPDLFIYNEIEFLLVEVKSSNDKLSESQKSWIENNFKDLKLPFKLAKIHKENTQFKNQK